MNVRAIIKQLESERSRIDSAISALSMLVPSRRRHHAKVVSMSAASRKRLSDAQKARWAKIKKAA